MSSVSDGLEDRSALEVVYQSIAKVLEEARNAAYRAVNKVMVEAYWQIGCIIVEEEQQGKARAEYGAGLIPALAKRLTAEFGKGFTETNLKYMRLFYLAFENRHAVRDELSWTHYRLLLKCFVLIDLKIGKLTHQDIGQMDFYVRFFEQEEKQASDNPTIGLILCSDRSEAMVRYTLLADSQQIFASKYKLHLPTEEELARELRQEREQMEQERRLSSFHDGE